MADENRLSDIRFDWDNQTHEQRAYVGSRLNDIKSFTFKAFSKLDIDGDGFITREELSEAFNDESRSWRERSFISFLLRRIDDIEDAFEEEWDLDADGISRVDVQVYFNETLKLLGVE